MTTKGYFSWAQKVKKTALNNTYIKLNKFLFQIQYMSDTPTVSHSSKVKDLFYFSIYS